MLFDYPGKDDEKIFRRRFREIVDKEPAIHTLAAGWFLNATGEEACYFLVGIGASGDCEKYIPAVMKTLRKDFYEHVPFRFTDLSDTGDLNTYLLKQGLVLRSAALA